MSRLYKNIKVVCKRNNIKMAEIEAPNKAGAISRYERRGKIMKLPLDMVYRISKSSGVSIEDLIEKDIETEIKREELSAKIEELAEELARLTDDE